MLYKFYYRLSSFYRVTYKRKDILIEHNPLLGVQPKKYYAADKFIQDIDSSLVFTDKSVNFLFAIEIIEKLYVNQSDSNAKYKLNPKYNFVVTDENIKTIKKLYFYRNSTLHKGDIILPAIPYDYFITQHVLPLINQFIKVEPNFILDEINPSVDCGINIFNEILNIKINIEDLKKDDYNKELSDNLCYLTHLKELGRSSFNRSISLPLKQLKLIAKKKKSIEDDFFSYDYSNDLKKIKAAEEYAKSLSSKEKVWEILNCPCCGAKTLLVFWHISQPIEDLPKAFKVTEEAKCQFCDYEINSGMGEPKQFKILKKFVFNNEDDIGWPFDSFSPTQEELDSYEDIVRSIMKHSKFNKQQ